MSWIAIIDKLDKDELLRYGFPYYAIVECALAFITDRPDKGYETFNFCMGVWIGWQITAEVLKKSAWNSAEKSIQTVG